MINTTPHPLLKWPVLVERLQQHPEIAAFEPGRPVQLTVRVPWLSTGTSWDDDDGALVDFEPIDGSDALNDMTESADILAVSPLSRLRSRTECEHEILSMVEHFDSPIESLLLIEVALAHPDLVEDNPRKSENWKAFVTLMADPEFRQAVLRRLRPQLDATSEGYYLYTLSLGMAYALPDDIEGCSPLDFATLCVNYLSIWNRIRYVKDSGAWSSWEGDSWETGLTNEAALRALYDWCKEMIRTMKLALADDPIAQALAEVNSRLRAAQGTHNLQRDKESAEATAKAEEIKALRRQAKALSAQNLNTTISLQILERLEHYSYEVSRLQKLLVQLAVLPGLLLNSSDFNTKHYLLPTPSGTVDLRTGRYTISSSFDLNTMTTRIGYRRVATSCPEWTAFINTVFPDPDEREAFRRCLGYSITGETHLRKMFVLRGATGAGKSTIMEVIADILGDYALGSVPMSAVTLSKTEQHPTDVATLEGRRFGVVPEVTSDKRLDSGLLKTLTGGGDTMTARKMRQDFITFKPVMKLWFTSNEAPQIDEQSAAMAERFVVFNLKQSFGSRTANHDPHLKAKLAKERMGILYWLVEAARDWYQDGADVAALRIPTSLDMELNEFLRHGDPLEEFFAYWVQISEADFIHSKDFYAAHALWRKQCGMHPIHKKTCTEAAKARGFRIVRREDGNYIGAKLTPLAEDALNQSTLDLMLRRS